MSESDIHLKNSIIQHYHDNSNLKQYMKIGTIDLEDFEPITHVTSFKSTDLSTIISDEYHIESIGRDIGIVLTNLEFSHFINSLRKITENTIETTMENLVETLDSVHSNLLDEEYETDLIFSSFSINREIRKRKNLTQYNTPKFLSTPIHAKELGNNQIFLASKNNFTKIYPKSFERLSVAINRITYHANHAEILSTIHQKLEIKNKYSIARIVVTNVENPVS